MSSDTNNAKETTMHMGGMIDIVDVQNCAGITLFLAPITQLPECERWAADKKGETGFACRVVTRQVLRAMYRHLAGDCRVDMPGERRNVR